MTETTDLERELRAALAEAHAGAPEPPGLADRLVAAATSGPSTPQRSGLRRSRPWLPPLAAAAAVLALVVGTDAVVTSLRDDGSRPAAKNPGLTTPLIAPQSLLDVRKLGFHVEPGPGFEETDDWGIERDHQWTAVAYGVDDRGPDVAVYYQGISPPLPSTGTREAVTINGSSGTYIEEIRKHQWGAHLAWEYAPKSWAVVSERGDAAPPPGLRTRLVTVAEAVRSGGKTPRVPIRVGTVPPTLPSVATADGVSVRYVNGDWTWWLSFHGDIHLWATSQTGMDCIGFDGSPYTADFTYRGHPGCLVDGERIGLGLGDANAFIDYVDSTPQPPIDDMKQVLADFTVASYDPATWFDLRTALGGE